MMTNAQTALLVSATLAAGKHLSNQAVITIAAEFKTALDLQDAQDRQAKGRVVKDRDLDTTKQAFGKTPKPDNVIVMPPGQLYPTAAQLIDTSTPDDTIFITYEQALAQGWTEKRYI